MEAVVKAYIRTDRLPREIHGEWPMDVVQAFWRLERELSRTYMQKGGWR